MGRTTTTTTATSWTAAILLLLVLVENPREAMAASCLNPSGQFVDWFIVYKTPQYLKRTGLPIVYMDNTNQNFNLAPDTIVDNTTAFARTLSQIYESATSDTFAYAMYSDAIPPATKDEELEQMMKPHLFGEYIENDWPTERLRPIVGHSKGVVAFELSGGFFFSHSVPNFPPRAQHGYSYPSSGTRYAQTMLCVSFNVVNMDAITTQLTFNYPDVYDSNLPASLEGLAPKMRQMIDKVPDQSTPGFSARTLVSRGGQTFVNFAKSDLWGRSLYSEIVAPHLSSDLRVQTWQNGSGGKMNSTCDTRHNVENILEVNLGPGPNGDMIYVTTKDHSKWAVSTEPLNAQQGWVCLGDVNRMESQNKRGGGTTCFVSSNAWKTFNALPHSIESC